MVFFLDTLFRLFKRELNELCCLGLHEIQHILNVLSVQTLQGLGWKHQWEEKTAWATEKRGTKRTLLICHSCWAGNLAVLVLQRLQGLPAQVPLVIPHQCSWMENIQGCWTGPLLKWAAVSESLFSLFTLQRRRECSGWGSRFVICHPYHLFWGHSYIFSGMKTPSWWKLNFYLPHCCSLTIHRTLVPHIT